MKADDDTSASDSDQPRSLKVLVLNPYDGGSQRQFFEEWESRSHHQFTVLGLPPRHFRWRMRQAAVHFANKANQLFETGHDWDLILSTALLSGAEFRGLLAPPLTRLPLVVYFHENQPNYPVRREDSRDLHFSLMNWTSALSAAECWFNSAYNRDSFLEGMRGILRKMPDHRSLPSLENIRKKTHVLPPGIEVEASGGQTIGPLHIVWVARWEHDKNPDDFVEALRKLKEANVDFLVTLLGQNFSDKTDSTALLRQMLGDHLRHAGFTDNKQDYWKHLARADVVVSTAFHEFFGLGVLEAVAAGCIPVLPNRLVYPELYPPDCLYEGGSEGLAARLVDLAAQKSKRGTLGQLYDSLQLASICRDHDWSNAAPRLDTALRDVAHREERDSIRGQRK